MIDASRVPDVREAFETSDRTALVCASCSPGFERIDAGPRRRVLVRRLSPLTFGIFATIVFFVAMDVGPRFA